MNKFNEIIINIRNKISDKKLHNYVNNLITNWFINLNLNDINILTILVTFISQRIIKLYDLDNLYIKQFTKNNNQDIKAIILLLLPFINDEKIDVYRNIKDLNELILNKQFNKLDLNFDRTQILNSHFKYSNIGIGLFDEKNELELYDKEFGKLIYKISYHNFIALNETLSIINGKMYVNWLNIFPITFEKYKDSNIYKKTINNIDKVINNDLNLLDYNGIYIGEFYNTYRNIYYESIKKIKWLIYIINKEYIFDYIQQTFNYQLFFEFPTYDDINKDEKTKFTLIINNIIYNLKDRIFLIWKNILLFLINSNYIDLLITEYKDLINPFIMNIEYESKEDDLIKYSSERFNNIKIDNVKKILEIIDKKYIWNFIRDSLINFENTIYYKFISNKDKFKNINLKNIYNIAKSLSFNLNKWEILPKKYSSLDEKQKINFWNKFNQKINNYEWINLQNNLNLEEGRNLDLFEYNNKLTNIIEEFNLIKYDLVWEYLVYFGLLTEFKINLEFTDSTNFKLNKRDFFKSTRFLQPSNLQELLNRYNK